MIDNMSVTYFADFGLSQFCRGVSFAAWSPLRVQARRVLISANMSLRKSVHDISVTSGHATLAQCMLNIVPLCAEKKMFGPYAAGNIADM